MAVRRRSELLGFVALSLWWTPAARGPSIARRWVTVARCCRAQLAGLGLSHEAQRKQMTLLLRDPQEQFRICFRAKRGEHFEFAFAHSAETI